MIIWLSMQKLISTPNKKIFPEKLCTIQREQRHHLLIGHNSNHNPEQPLIKFNPDSDKKKDIYIVQAF